MSLSDFNNLQDLVDSIFTTNTWARQEIMAAQRRHPDGADRICKSSRLLTPTHGLMSTASVYRAHCREVLDRVAAGEDTRPGTAAECCIALCKTSLRAPLTTSAVGLYVRMWARAGLPPVEMSDSSAYYEALAGSAIDENEAWLRHKVRQAWRA
ncbi:hypothetical protein [Plantactinospora sp. CA-290183]|uniref:hypothetical protein n=1 Tax=Plantactinospora sp. CA-290183 TaxID=3240006 RepID=UPI003D94AD48